MSNQLITYTMTKIVGVESRISKDKNLFVALVLAGGLDIAVNKNGNQYAAVMKTSIPVYLPLEEAKLLVGNELPGTIERIECPEYDWTDPSGQIRKLHHKYVYKA